MVTTILHPLVHGFIHCFILVVNFRPPNSIETTVLAGQYVCRALLVSGRQHYTQSVACIYVRRSSILICAGGSNYEKEYSDNVEQTDGVEFLFDCRVVGNDYNSGDC